MEYYEKKEKQIEQQKKMYVAQDVLPFFRFWLKMKMPVLNLRSSYSIFLTEPWTPESVLYRMRLLLCLRLAVVLQAPIVVHRAFYRSVLDMPGVGTQNLLFAKHVLYGWVLALPVKAMAKSLGGRGEDMFFLI